MILLIIVSIFQSYTKTSPPISTSVTTLTKNADITPMPNYTIPVNPFPTDNEIEESIKVRNEQGETVKQALADKMQKIATISEEIRANQNEPASSLPTAENNQTTVAQGTQPVSQGTKFKQIPKEIIQQVQSHRYFVR